MLSITKSMALHGLEGFLIDVQVDISAGMPSWDIVGLPDTSVKEAKERVRTAIKNSGYELFSRKIVVNLAPADIKKEGSLFDLPIAVGILTSLDIVYSKNIEDILMIGELSLNGNLNPINGALPICIEAKKLGIKKVILPQANAKEASVIDGIEIVRAPVNERYKHLLPKTDMGMTWVDGSDNGSLEDAAYSGKSLRRKVASVENGITKFKDTNNSSIDFIVGGGVPTPGIIPTTVYE